VANKPKVNRYREDSWMVPGHEEAARRIAAHQGRIFPAFTSLDVGFDVEAAQEYLDGAVKTLMAHSVVKENAPGDKHEEFAGRLTGVILAFAMTAVEADRENRDV
jgi:hypothetical protein